MDVDCCYNMRVSYIIIGYISLSGGGGPTGPNVVRQLVSMLKIAVRLHRTAYSALFKTQIKYDLATNFAWTSDIQ